MLGQLLSEHTNATLHTYTCPAQLLDKGTGSRNKVQNVIKLVTSTPPKLEPQFTVGVTDSTAVQSLLKGSDLLSASGTTVRSTEGSAVRVCPTKVVVVVDGLYLPERARDKFRNVVLTILPSATLTHKY